MSKFFIINGVHKIIAVSTVQTFSQSCAAPESLKVPYKLAVVDENKVVATEELSLGREQWEMPLRLFSLTRTALLPNVP